MKHLTHSALCAVLVFLLPFCAHGAVPLTQSDGIFNYQVMLTDTGGMTAASWTISVRGNSPVTLRTFSVAYLCGDDFVDKVEQELRGTVWPGREAKLAGDYYVCINHGPVKSYDVLQLTIDSPYPGLSNTFQCNNGKGVTYTVDFPGDRAVRLRRFDGVVTTFSSGEITDRELSDALCGNGAEAPAGLLEKLRSYILKQLGSGRDTTTEGANGKRG